MVVTMFSNRLLRAITVGIATTEKLGRSSPVIFWMS